MSEGGRDVTDVQQTGRNSRMVDKGGGGGGGGLGVGVRGVVWVVDGEVPGDGRNESCQASRGTRHWMSFSTGTPVLTSSLLLKELAFSRVSSIRWAGGGDGGKRM